MSLADLRERFDAFQEDAVRAIERDFSQNPRGRYLLVIPTAGGKTRTAAKAVNRLFETGVLDAGSDCVLWTAHRTELLSQAKDTYTWLAESCPNTVRYSERVLFEMKDAAARHVVTDRSIGLVVIDEAHHGAADGYQPFFQRPELGVLGLTATPSRHDGKRLEFERESFSIGFPDLVKKGVILRPEVRRVEGGRYEIASLEDENALEQLNNSARNRKIISELSRHSEEYKKVIIYVGTRAHTVSLYRELRDSPLKDAYESIGYITGEGNSRDQERGEFIKREKTFRRSILVNVQVLSEGYDDPSVNTVVMATPTRSKLYYMQAMGRAIRIDPEDPLKKAFIVEVEDTLPNIRYRIDNRWLYADISDVLEPEVVDVDFGSAEDFAGALRGIYERYNVPSVSRVFPDYRAHYRYTMLLFRIYVAPGQFQHHPLLIDNGNRLSVSNMFNFLSERMSVYRAGGANSEVVFQMIDVEGVDGLRTELGRSHVFHAMENASAPEDEMLSACGSWITFVAFHYRQREDEIPDEILEFCRDMVNNDSILEIIRAQDYPEGAYLLRLPLPLCSCVGKIVTASEFNAVSELVGELARLKAEKGRVDHWDDVRRLLESSALPLELRHWEGLVLVARDDVPYYLQLK